jgi:hypothetical protein
MRAGQWFGRDGGSDAYQRRRSAEIFRLLAEKNGKFGLFKTLCTG